MKRINRVWNRLVYDVAPVVFGMALVTTIISLSCGVAALAIKWMLSVVGVNV